jgi:uncharacterized membrane protein
LQYSVVNCHFTPEKYREFLTSFADNAPEISVTWWRVENPDQAAQINELRELVSDLTKRLYRLEQALNLDGAASTPRPLPPIAPPTMPSVPSPGATPPPAKSQPVIPRPSVGPAPVVPEADLESRIGSHWLNRIGIAAVLIGVSYFIKFAFENNWIGSAGRVTIGLLAGIVVVIWSERFRYRGYKFFSYSLKAVGIGVLYLSLWAAFQVYSLIPSGVAFAAMLAVTAATGFMALSQDAEILAAFAMAGGFSTPALLSTGQNRELALFSYVAILDIGCLALVVFRPWRRLLILSYLGTLLLYVGWYSSFYDHKQIELTVAFATLFFVLFAIAPLLARRPQSEPNFYAAVPSLLAFVNAGVYFLQIYVMFSEIGAAQTAWFALALAALYILLSHYARLKYPDPALGERLRLLHLALAIGFITVAIPIRLDAHWITIGWFVEAAVLLWVADRIHSDLLNLFAVGALVLGVIRLLVFDDFHSTQLIFNARMGTYAVAIAVLGAVAWYASKRNDDTGRSAAAFAIVALNLLALVVLSREVADYYSHEMAAVRPSGPWMVAQWARRRSIEISRDFTYSALWMAYGAMLIVVGFWRRSAFVRWQALALIAFTTLKVFVYDVSELDRVYRILSFVALGVLLLAISFAYQRDWLKLSAPRQGSRAPQGTAK